MPMKLSLNGLLADLEDGTTDRTPLSSARPTQRGHDLVWKYWLDYLPRINEPTLTPVIGVMKAFFTMLAKERRGQLGDRLSVSSLIEYSRASDFVYKKYSRGEIGLSTRTRKKPIAKIIDLKDLIGFLWMNDPVNFLHERTRVQLALLILMTTFTASRPGPIVESHACCLSGQAILYEILEIATVSMFWISHSLPGF
ncbi:uncharacterized protein EAF01_010857 [Botrytis porri]|uniref:uncharacterized protein n=1 Tax=Botrytis porri TaxID=87229 RepID=UPI001900A5D5|nr:uncharacterized protein EAF01_010857 [Botrytis porri]KAF7889364.1 hypothetical protein EAF01_010857 [Botrytis porri]